MSEDGSASGRSGRGNEAETVFHQKSASYSENGIGGNARPHPGPLPQERGKHAQLPEFSCPLVWNCFMGTYVGGYANPSGPATVCIAAMPWLMCASRGGRSR